MGYKQIVLALGFLILLSSLLYFELFIDSIQHQLLLNNKLRWMTNQQILTQEEEHNNQNKGHDDIEVIPTPVITVEQDAVSSPICSQDTRRQIFHKACENHLFPVGSNQSIKRLRGLIVDDRHKLVYCGAAKGGSTAWLNLLVKASGKTKPNQRLVVHSNKVLSAHGLRRLASYNTTDIKYILNNYFKFIVVRHPFERIVSAWRDKFIMPDGPYKKLGRKIAQEYRKFRNVQQNSTNQDGYWDTRALFVEFAWHLASTHFRDPHWMNYVRCCNPCSVDWDAIIKVETTQHDSTEVIFPKLGDDISVTSLPVIHSHQERSTLNHFVKELPELDYIRPNVLRYLYREYGAEMDLFGYSWNQTSLVATCGTKSICC